MTCPLSTLANINTRTAERSQTKWTLDFWTPSSAGSTTAAAAGVADMSTVMGLAGTLNKTKPFKKRSISAASLGTSNHHTDHKMGNNKSNKKSKKTVLTRPEIKREAAEAPFKMEVNQLSFPAILVNIMSTPKNEEYIAFLADGQHFVILRPEALVKHVLPNHFEEEIPTFGRFLYLLAVWGFEAVQEYPYPELNVFRHPMFSRGNWEACLQIEMPREEGNVASQKQSVDHTPAAHTHALLAHAERREQPPSPPREFSFADTAVELRSTSIAVRAVTPAEDITLLPTGMLQNRVDAAAPAPSMTHDSATSQWMVPTTTLEQMNRATAETRRRLFNFSAAVSTSPHLEELAIYYPVSHTMHPIQGMGSSLVTAETKHCLSGLHTTDTSSPSLKKLPSTYPEFQTMHRIQAVASSLATAKARRRLSGMHSVCNMEELAMKHPELHTMYRLQGMERSSGMRCQTADDTAAASMVPRTMRRMPSPPPFVPETGLTDAQVQMATNDVVSAAMVALNGIEQRQPRHTTPPASPSSRLNMMTERFIKTSYARRLQSRPAGITGSYSSITLSDVIHARTRTLLACRHVSDGC